MEDARDGIRSVGLLLLSFFFNDTATTEIYTLSLHDALPIYMRSENREFYIVLKKQQELVIKKKTVCLSRFIQTV